MDWHKLQHKLFAMDPVDPAKELAMLRATAQTPTPLEETDYLKESVQVTEGSLPIAINSIADFAKLAGVRLDEKQLTGRAGQAHGGDPMPKAEYGRTKHPLKDKLVGEGPISAIKNTISAVKNNPSLQRGYQNYNTGAAIGLGGGGGRATGAPPNRKNAAPAYAQSSKTLAAALAVTDKTSFASGVANAQTGAALSARENAALAQAFQNLMRSDDKVKRRALALMKPNTPTPVVAAPPAPSTAPGTTQPVTSSKQYPNQMSIKEQLLKKLNDLK